MNKTTYIDKKGIERSAISKSGKFKPNAIKYWFEKGLQPKGYSFNEKGHLVKNKPFDLIDKTEIRKMTKNEFNDNFGWYGFKTKTALFKYVKEKNIKTFSSLNDAKGNDYTQNKASLIPKFIKKNVGKFIVKKAQVPFENFEDEHNINHIGLKEDYLKYLEDVKNIIFRKVNAFLRRGDNGLVFNAVNGLKFQFRVRIKFYKINPDTEEVVYKTQEFSHPSIRVLNPFQVEERVNEAINIIIKLITKYIKESSGWRIERILNSNVSIMRYALPQGSSWFQLDDWIQKKKAVINIKNEDDDQR